MVFQKADAVSDVGVRQRGLRPAPGAAAFAAPSSTTRVESALRDAAMWDEVKDKLHADGRSLSGGQQQRLCIARTHRACSPEVLLFDEPTAALDPISTLRVEETLQALREKLLHRDRHAQSAAGGARVERHRLHVPGRAGGDRAVRADFHLAEESHAPMTTSPADSAEERHERHRTDRQPNRCAAGTRCGRRAAPAPGSGVERGLNLSQRSSAAAAEAQPAARTPRSTTRCSPAATSTCTTATSMRSRT